MIIIPQNFFAKESHHPQTVQNGCYHPKASTIFFLLISKELKSQPLLVFVEINVATI